MNVIRTGFFAFCLGVASTNVLAEAYAPGACSLVPESKTCADSTACKTMTDGNTVCLKTANAPSGAIVLDKACWKYSYTYACQSSTVLNTCTQFENNTACGVTASSCSDVIPETGQCDQWLYTYKCLKQEAQTAQVTSCAQGLFKANLPNPVVKNSNFGLAAAASEALRLAQTYSQDGSNIFAGVQETCGKGYMGLKNCCKSQPGGKSNGALASTASATAYTTVKYVGAKAIDKVSPYVFDAMYKNGLFTEGMWQSFYLGPIEETGLSSTVGTELASPTLGIGAYGLTYYPGISTIASLDTAVQTGQVMAGTSGVAEIGGGVLSFNPYMFAAAIIMQYAMSLMSCSEDEQMLAMHKGANLSVFVKEECTSKVLGMCMEYTSYYCSFNSVLAKLINTQGKPQLGRSLEDCSGFSVEEVTKLDFTKIDLSEYTNQVVSDATANMPNSAQINAAYSNAMSSGTTGTAQSKTSTVLPSY